LSIFISGWTWGISLSIRYINNAPKATPIVVIKIDEKDILCGIRLRKEMANITPAAKASILNMNFLEGYFIIPNMAPTIGPIIEIIKRRIILFINQ